MTDHEIDTLARIFTPLLTSLGTYVGVQIHNRRLRKLINKANEPLSARITTIEQKLNLPVRDTTGKFKAYTQTKDM